MIRRGLLLFFAAAILSFLHANLSAACLQSNLTQGSQTTGAVYQLYMPESGCWNGKLVVYAHGYVAPGSPIAVPQEQLMVGDASLPATFNQLGYAFAASSFRKNGLAILEGVDDTRDLVQNVLQPTLKPTRVYLIGASEGGLVTALSAEQLPHVYNAAGAACGPIGSFQGEINYLGDFRVIFDYFFPKVLPGNVTYFPPDQLPYWYTKYVPDIITAMAANPSASAQLINVTKAAVSSDPASAVETALQILWYSAFATNDAAATLGGNPFDNTGRIYTGSANDLVLNIKVQRYHASPAARAAIATHYETSGKLMMPTVTLHTTADPQDPYWHETLYTLKTLAAGAFLERTNLPVNRYGHCSFTSGELLTAFGIIVLRDGL
jgi:pimeloyl-ACP methyl ester carboxylesterase